jgi:hypothetical protein
MRFVTDLRVPRARRPGRSPRRLTPTPLPPCPSRGNTRPPGVTSVLGQRSEAVPRGSALGQRWGAVL